MYVCVYMRVHACVHTCMHLSVCLSAFSLFPHWLSQFQVPGGQAGTQHYSVNGHLEWSCVSAIANSASVNMDVQVSL